MEQMDKLQFGISNGFQRRYVAYFGAVKTLILKKKKLLSRGENIFFETKSKIQNVAIKL